MDTTKDQAGDASAAAPGSVADVSVDPTGARRGVGGLAGYTRLLTSGAVVVAFVVMVVLFAALRPDTFATVGTVKDILDEGAVPVMLVCGLTFILASGQFDLSFTGTLGVTSAIVAALMSFDHTAVPVAILLAVLASLVAGVIVGLAVALRPASTFIVTLALGSAFTGAELAVSGDQTIYNNIPNSFGNLASLTFLGLDRSVWVALVILIVTCVLLHGTRFGRHVSATGSNSSAAFLAGVRIRRVWAFCFIILSVTAGLAAITYTSTTAEYIPGSFSTYLLSSYAAVFLGSTIGGRFTIPGSVFGVIWLATLQAGLTQLNEPVWTSSLVEGLVLATAVVVSSRGWRART